MWQLEKNTAENRVATQEARTWKSRVNATIRCVRLHFGTSHLEVSLTWPADSDMLGEPERTMRPAKEGLIVKLLKQSLSLLLSWCLVLATAPEGFAVQAGQSSAPPPVQASPGTVQTAHQTPEQLQQLVAPIALYPDALVAQILAAATYPDQIVEGDRWLQQHTNLKSEELGNEVDKQPWDPSVKALVEFPSVLGNMDKNLSWTSSLGDAYVNQQEDVMNAVQVMRDRAERAGNLKSTSQERVSKQGQTIVIEPAEPEVVYVPQYDPWLVYGGPIGIWPGWYSYPGLYLAGPGIAFGFGFGMGFFGGFGWGWHHWGYDWHGHGIIYNHNTYISHSRVFVNRNNFNRAGGFHGGNGFHGASGFYGGATRGFNGSPHGFASPHGQSGAHSGAFSGFNHGGVTRGFSSRGQSSYGGGFHGGGGGHVGGGHR
jgi:uncharacterized protein DUF3300